MKSFPSWISSRKCLELVGSWSIVLSISPGCSPVSWLPLSKLSKSTYLFHLRIHSREIKYHSSPALNESLEGLPSETRSWRLWVETETELWEHQRWGWGSSKLNNQCIDHSTRKRIMKGREGKERWGKLWEKEKKFCSSVPTWLDGVVREHEQHLLEVHRKRWMSMCPCSAYECKR